jgi:hypothetical protein
MLPGLFVPFLHPLEGTVRQLAFLVQHQVTTLAERHALQINGALWLQCRAWGKCGSPGHLWLLVNIHSVGLSFHLLVASQLLQNPAYAFFPHGHLDKTILLQMRSALKHLSMIQ